MNDNASSFTRPLGRILERCHEVRSRNPEQAAFWSAETWRELGELGIPAALVAEPNGGVGLVPSEVFEIMKAVGSHAAPLPVVESMLAGWLWQDAKLAALSKPAVIGTAAEETLQIDDAVDGGLVISGVIKEVYWGRFAAIVVAAAPLGETEVLMALPVDRGRLVEGENLAGEHVDRIQYERFWLAPGAFLEISGSRWGMDVRCFGALARCAQMVGAMEKILSLSLAFTRARVQFGRPIIKFQILQHYLAVMSAEIAAASIAARAAFRGPAPWQNDFQVAAAKSRVGQAVAVVTALTHQAHGAMGFAEEYDLHLFTRRLWSWRDEFGSEIWWNSWLGRQIISSEPAPLWDILTDLDG